MAWTSLFLIIFLCFLASHTQYYHSNAARERDTLHQGQQLRDWDKLVSANGVYKFQFFSNDKVLRSSAPRYIGICLYQRSYPDFSVKVWVANPESPIPDTSGVVIIDGDGVLKFSYGGRQPIAISSNLPAKTSENKNISVTLLDSGNLVLREVDSCGVAGPVLWQSFDYPSDTLLPRMKLGFNLKTKHEWSISTWLSSEVPSPGAFKLGLDPDESNQLIIWRRGNVYWRSGVWKNGSFPLSPQLTKRAAEYEFRFVQNENEHYFSYLARNKSTQLIWELGDFGEILQHSLDLDNSILNQLEGTRPCNFTDAINKNAVCLNEKPTKCRNGTSEFFVSAGKGYVDGSALLYDPNASLALSDCHAKCWKNCSCGAFESWHTNGTGCALYSRESNFIAAENLYDVYLLTHEDIKDSPTGASTRKERSRSIIKSWWIWFIIAIAPVLLLSAIFCHLRRKNGKLTQQTGETGKNQDKSLLAIKSKLVPSYKLSAANHLKKGNKKGQELVLFSFLQITTATNNFATTSKLGEGGFGPVYKGILPDGQQIAVKRLGRRSGQGLVEFKNEITLIAELQHMNLVKLLGCCIEREEKMLIYDYMPNKSLDFFLFDPSRRKELDWKTRFNIIEGVSQGLLYLHKYSRLRVIHRDLKASNILLDGEMNPKISDFGLARIFGQNEYEANTNRVVGTYGYMSPEYAMNGIYSVKSDVYSFGILLLEIVSGMRNTVISHTSGPLTLIEHAWNLWTRGASLELKDSFLDSSCSKNEFLRCVHVGLLCVQECAMDRPTMLDVTIMLTNENIPLAEPKQPGFCIGRYKNAVALPTHRSDNCSVYHVSITEMEAR